MKKIIKNLERGITLIALVITIIVLLILAGVSIAMLTGENGILNKAIKARENTIDAQNYENSILSSYENVIDETINNNSNIESGENYKPEIKTTDEDLKAWVEHYNGFSFSTLDEALQSELLMNEFMNSTSAVDYMLTNENIMNKVLNSKIAMSKLGESDYASHKVVTDKNLFSKVRDSSCFEEFNNSRMLIPLLSSNECDEGVASYTGTLYSDYAPFKAFDRSNVTSWCTQSLGTLQFKFNNPKYAYRIILALRNNAGLNSLVQKFEGTIILKLDDVEVYSSGKQQITVNEEFEIELNDIVEFDTIIFNTDSTISSSGSNWAGLTEMQVYGCDV